MEQVPTLLVDDEKLKDPTNVANAFQYFLCKNYWKIKYSTYTERRC
jgi:hypothetical protein